MSAPRTPGGEGDQPPQPVMAGALAAQPAPAPATADGIDTIAAEIRAGLREHTDLMEDAVGIRFSREAARATGGLDALAALPEPRLQDIFSRAGVSVLLGNIYRMALGAYRAARDRTPEPPLAKQAVARSCV